MNALLTCVSHGPALMRPMPETDMHPHVVEAYAARARALAAFDPELVIICAPDHYTGVHLQMVPPFCIAFGATAVDDYGGAPGRLDVARDLASECLAAVRAADIDVAASHDMTVDHGFSQPLQLLAGAIDRYPTIPVLINTTCRPLSSFRRVRMLGEAIGAFAAGLGKRVAFIASGGLSHHPANIFPQDLAAVPDELRSYLVHGGMGGGLDRDAWIAQLGARTVLGGEMVMRGERTASDFRLNPAWDEAFLARYATGDFAAFDDWEPAWVIEQAGVAAMEVQQWICAGAAATRCGAGAISTDFYSARAEYRLAIGVAHADPAAA
ncbi:3-carboxyethylcatechol 2,3-dioxygenase [Sphingomonas bacterium]|uniref:DODA-type extradiol aromatic ring-opening family dioxygenase n=1 Tax=Sphingomonas bacterium TaxID=1895847 RepID=UPI001574FD43|nr:3-carboxyethylcatechol 2,3-dioxygenase [Sphingomonas bacterium]